MNSQEDLAYYMKLIEDLLNGRISKEKEGAVRDYINSNEEWRNVLRTETLLKELGKSLRKNGKSI